MALPRSAAFVDLFAHVGDDTAGEVVEGLAVVARQGQRRDDSLLDAPGVEAGLGQDAEDVRHRGKCPNFPGIPQRDRSQAFAICAFGFVEWSAVAQIPVRRSIRV